MYFYFEFIFFYMCHKNGCHLSKLSAHLIKIDLFFLFLFCFFLFIKMDAFGVTFSIYLLKWVHFHVKLSAQKVLHFSLGEQSVKKPQPNNSSNTQYPPALPLPPLPEPYNLLVHHKATEKNRP